MNSDMFNRFSENPVNMNISRSMFNRNHSVKFSGNVGDLIPFYVDEVLPGDTFNVDTAKVVRMQPLVCPVMDNLFLDTYYFFIPNMHEFKYLIRAPNENIPMEILLVGIITIIVISICLLISKILRISPILTKYLFGVFPKTVK